jgi:hypothetical protein
VGAHNILRQSVTMRPIASLPSPDGNSRSGCCLSNSSTGAQRNNVSEVRATGSGREVPDVSTVRSRSGRQRCASQSQRLVEFTRRTQGSTWVKCPAEAAAVRRKGWDTDGWMGGWLRESTEHRTQCVKPFGGCEEERSKTAR